MKRPRKLPFHEGALLVWMLLACLSGVSALFLLSYSAGRFRGANLAEGPRLRWLPDRPTKKTDGPPLQYVIAETLDPSLMSLPNEHGFSRSFWARQSPPSHRDSEWNIEPAFLKASKPAAFESLLAQASLPSLVQSAVAKLEAASEMPPAETPELSWPVSQSAFRILGALETRLIARAPQLPVLTNQAALRPTRIRVGVGADGLVRFAVPDRSSGNEAVDEQALAWARQIRFDLQTDANGGDLTWGVIQFLWATGNGAKP